MNHFAKDRDRLLHDSARVLGLSAVVLSLICVAVSDDISPPTLLSALPLFALLALGLVKVGSPNPLLWVIPALSSGIGLLWVISAISAPEPSAALSAGMVFLAGGALAAFSVLLLTSVIRILIWGVSVLLSVSLSAWATTHSALISGPSAAILLGWILAATFFYWVNSSVPPVARRIASIGRAHRAERQASETEAQRRQSARLLHDTVLATLTMLAHSGVGVSAAALQHQAGDDARLLRQLRLGGTPVPQSSEHYKLLPVAESELGHTLESVKSRFGRIGLAVTWHGTGQILLPSPVLDAMLLALAECLENVRRHSGVSDAHVTITDDDTTVRAMVTDTGIGFVLDEVDPARLGFHDSVVNRLREVGGTARLFSSPGAGTTVVLEVPR